MKSVAFFNNKGGVGKTSLVYHVAWMLADIGLQVLAVDLDPQGNLTSMFVDEERLEAIWEMPSRPTIYGAVAPQFRGIGDILPPVVETIDERIGLLVGDLDLSALEDDLSGAWPRCANGDERSFRVMSAFSRTVTAAGLAVSADIALIDVGPNLGALNRAALLGCDHIVVPLGADLFSLQGLRNMGPRLREWRDNWESSRKKNRDPALLLPMGAMNPAGYIVMRHSVQAGRPAVAYGRWIERIPRQYTKYVLDQGAVPDLCAGDDPNCLGVLKDYRSLMPLAQEARKPMFFLRPGDGAFGGHQQAVRGCYDDFRKLTTRIADSCEIALPVRRS